MAEFKDPIRDQEIRRWKEREKKDLEVEHNKGPRPLEGFSGGHTTWTGDQDDAAARTVHAHDEEKSEELSEEQAEPASPRGEPEDEK
ncbi:MAG: hypothetical protein ACJ790_00105 [Myxococcaceae bacterium]